VVVVESFEEYEDYSVNLLQSKEVSPKNLAYETLAAKAISMFRDFNLATD